MYVCMSPGLQKIAMNFHVLSKTHFTKIVVRGSALHRGGRYAIMTTIITFWKVSWSSKPSIHFSPLHFQQ